ncbi:sarcosine oxidase subunit alpha family protein [Phaeovulum vinaykumarii]|uniref:Sarcosine oxidase subunit alpha n=1 Tax=Phaeovulum vinaykumarii TaxID=407234 RepID=A0A1N7JQX0_9RHOB|nr:sarcosine oxidase subunit alpha family protein [Phaeovulum vinaykumarii]SIS51707.1 sarcosine oxidase subunit alpha [Phaeovulum vinaykumarii]SOB90879.1 heterotetrameric sarcosine oxidase alpha subunit [Phaeovulum vinaykumarii]
MTRRITRLDRGGRLIDRARDITFCFDGRRIPAHPGDTLASALLGAGHVLQGRSFKYHRPRGPVAAGAEEPNALVTLGGRARMEPDLRTTTTEAFDGAEARSQNRWPGLGLDLLAINDRLSAFMPAGFYYKTFMAGRSWEKLFEPIIRRSAGLGPAPTEADPDSYEQAYAFADVIIVGGGVAGLAAALEHGRAGARVWVLEQTPHWGGRAVVDAEADGATIDGLAPEAWVKAALAELEALPNVTLRTRMLAAGLHDHAHLIALESVADTTPGADLPRQRLWRMRAGKVIVAAGALERPLSFPGNDRPGVMLASAVRDYIVNWAVSPGKRIVILTNNDDAYRTALVALDAGIAIPAILDLRKTPNGPLVQAVRDRGVRILPGHSIAKVLGSKQVKGIALCRHESRGEAWLERIPCDAVAMSGGWSPTVHLWSHCGGKLAWDTEAAFFAPDPDKPPLGADGKAMAQCVGAAAGALRLDACLASAMSAAPQVETPAEEPIQPVWVTPAEAGPHLRAKMWLDFQNDVKVSDIQLAAREGYQSVEHAKRYTTLGMATDQGKLSNINGLAILSQALDQPIPATGTTTFRPPYTPIGFGAIAGEARGEIFQPLRRTAMDAWHEDQGAHWEPVGQWRRPYCYPGKAEPHSAAIEREVLAVRNSVGMLDASTLGKIIVKGPDAGRFLDMIYTNMMSTLAVGKCRYGLMCSENGFLMDDGVVARLSEDTWLCHTTTGGAEAIHAHMEDWLQCEWWDWKVWTANVTEAYAQVAVAGPNARKVLEALGGVDVSREALPHMSWTAGPLGGFDARIYRISFSGELGFEIAVPTSQGMALWSRLLEAGKAFDIRPYGTEALHVLRAEKGFIMIGDETDGTVIPQDLGLNWALSKKKADFLGKRAHQRSFMASPDRWKLVGLESLDGSVIPECAIAPAPGENANRQRNTQGRITSSYYSPTLKRGIAMGLVHNGPDRMGEEIIFNADGKEVTARIVSPVFYDPKGEKLDV